MSLYFNNCLFLNTYLSFNTAKIMEFLKKTKLFEKKG